MINVVVGVTGLERYRHGLTSSMLLTDVISIAPDN
jgi:hypothetical protein